MSDNTQGSIGQPVLNYWLGFSNSGTPGDYKGTAPPVGIFAFYTGWDGAVSNPSGGGMMASQGIRRRMRSGRFGRYG